VLPVARHGARERALELLYEAEVKGSTVGEILAALPLAPDQYARELVEGVATHQDAHDEVLRQFVKGGWTLERMPTLDRLILRLGVEELANQAGVPTAVILDEAVQLAKAFSTDDSGRFVNGMLAAIARSLRVSHASDSTEVVNLDDAADMPIADAGTLDAAPRTVLPIGVSFTDERPSSLDESP
jgi:transcription antitermination protein NusB